MGVKKKSMPQIQLVDKFDCEYRKDVPSLKVSRQNLLDPNNSAPKLYGNVDLK